METKIFGNKQIITRSLLRADFENPKPYQDFINSLIKEPAPTLKSEKKAEKQVRQWLKIKFKKVQEKKAVFLLSFCNEKIVGRVEIYLDKGRRQHVGILSIAVKKGYRDRGLGSYLITRILGLAQKRLSPLPEIIRLSVFRTNKEAIKFYRRFGFKRVAVVPCQYKFQGKFVDEIIMLKPLFPTLPKAQN